MYYRNLVAAMGNLHAAEAWRTACELDAECAVLCEHVQEFAKSNAELRYSKFRLKRQIDDLDAVIVKQRDAQTNLSRAIDEAIDAGHEASIAFLREQAQRRLAARSALNFGLGLLVVLSAIVIGVLAGALMTL